MTKIANYDFGGTTVLVIGGNSGIGRATARGFARAGANVAVADLPLHDGKAIEDELIEAGAREAFFQPLDVRSEEQIVQAMARVAERLGPIGVAINNAGIEGPFAGLHELSAEDFDQVVAVNLRGVFLGMKHQIAHMIGSGGGVILNTTSSAGIRALPNVGGYSAAKHGIIGLTRAGALEQAANNIRINAVAPGPVDTGFLERMVAGHIPVSAIAAQLPIKRISQPSEIAEVYLWLASDAASFVTGEVIMVDGGLTVA